MIRRPTRSTRNETLLPSRCSCDLDCAHTIPPIIGDRAQMSQLLHNLVGNAMKYGRAGTPVTVRLEPGDTGDVTLTVVDRGDGIPPEHLPRLTERFYQIGRAHV